jgi:hypothetical protein
MFAFVRRIAKLFTSWSDTTPTQNMAATLSLEPVRRIRGGKRASLPRFIGISTFYISRPALGAGLVASRQTFVCRCQGVGSSLQTGTIIRRRSNSAVVNPHVSLSDQRTIADTYWSQPRTDNTVSGLAIRGMAASDRTRRYNDKAQDVGRLRAFACRASKKKWIFLAPRPLAALRKCAGAQGHSFVR